MADPHIPVLLRPLLAAVAPVGGIWLDGTFGAGGYAKGLLAAGADTVIGVDRDPQALEMAEKWAGDYGDPAAPGGRHVLRARHSRRGSARRRRPRPRRVVDADRPARTRLFLPEGRPARHADEPGRRKRRRSGQPRRRSRPRRHPAFLRRGTRRPPHRPRHCRGRAKEPITTTARLAEIVTAACRARNPARPIPPPAASRRCASRSTPNLPNCIKALPPPSAP